jgi:hypothetical protein
MSKLINTIATAALTTGILFASSVFAKTTEESLEAVQPKSHGPHAVLGAAQEICAGVCSGKTGSKDSIGSEGV